MEQDQRKNIEYKPIQIILYFVLTFLIAWAFMIPWAKRGGDSFPLVFAGYGPFLAAVILIRISKGRTELRRWLRKVFRLRIHTLLYLAGVFFLPFIIGSLHYGLYRVLGGQPDFSIANPGINILQTCSWYFSFLVALRNPVGEASHFPPCLSDFIHCWPP